MWLNNIEQHPVRLATHMQAVRKEVFQSATLPLRVPQRRPRWVVIRGHGNGRLHKSILQIDQHDAGQLSGDLADCLGVSCSHRSFPSRLLMAFLDIGDEALHLVKRWGCY